MKPQISEFSYGYAITEELTSGLGPLQGAPIFPSLRAEGGTGGYDVELPLEGMPLFLQFKVSDHLVHPNANEWNRFDAPYYRMYLRPARYSRQHELMLAWEQEGHEVYYIAPLFSTSEELNEYYQNNRVFERSVLFHPSDIGPQPDNNEHYVVFTPDNQEPQLYSKKSRPVKPPLLGTEFASQEIVTLRARKTEINIPFFETLTTEFMTFSSSQNASSIVTGILNRIPDTRTLSPLQAAQSTAILAQALFDAFMVILFEPTDTE